MRRSSIRDDKPVSADYSGIDDRLIREIASSDTETSPKKKRTLLPRRQVEKPADAIDPEPKKISSGWAIPGDLSPGKDPTAAERAGARRYRAASHKVSRSPSRQGAAAGNDEAKSSSSKPGSDRPVSSFPKPVIRGKTFFRDLGAYLRQVREYIHLKRLSFSVEKEAVFRFLITFFLLIFFSIFQTTFGARFQLFGAVPDLMLGFVIAVAMSEGEKWGAVTGLFAGLIIDALGGPAVPVSVLLYVFVGWTAGFLTENVFTSSIPVRIIYSVGAGFGRMLLSGLLLLTKHNGMTVAQAFTDVLLPEYLSTLLLAVFPHLVCHLCLHRFHKTRAERIN